MYDIPLRKVFFLISRENLENNRLSISELVGLLKLLMGALENFLKKSYIFKGLLKNVEKITAFP